MKEGYANEVLTRLKDTVERISDGLAERIGDVRPFDQKRLTARERYTMLTEMSPEDHFYLMDYMGVTEYDKYIEEMLGVKRGRQ
jgi:hypothetical protein